MGREGQGCAVGPGPGLCGKARPAPRTPAADGSSAFSSAMINEFLLMDFWLAFSRHLAHSSASCHSSNGTAHDPDKGSAG